MSQSSDIVKAKKRAYYLANRERIKANTNARYHANREVLLVQHKQYRDRPERKVRQQELTKKWRQENKEYKVAVDTEYRQNNKEYIANHKKKDYEGNKRPYFIRNLRALYRITFEQFSEMLIAQSGRCLICTDPMSKPHVDHNHNTGKIRGLLCGGCNTGIGLLRENKAILESAIKYLET